MDQFELKYFTICRLHLLIIGLWPYQTKITAIPIRILALAEIISFGFEKTYRLIKKGNNMEVFIADIPYFCMWLGIAAGYVCCFCQLETLKGLLERIKHDWHCAVLDKEDHILEAITKQGWKQSIFILSFTSILATMYCIFQFAPDFLSDKFPWNTTHPRQPFIGAFLLDPDKDYSFRLPYDYVLVVGAVLISSAGNMQFHMLITHACGTFRIFGHRLEHAFHNSSKKCIEQSRLHTAFVHIIEQHRQIMEYVNTLNSYYTLYCCIVGFGCVLTTSTLLVNVCLYLGNGRNLELAILAGLNLAGLFLHTYFFCASAQELVNASSDVFHQMYCGEWYTAPISNQKTLLLIMCNCLQPVAVSLSTIFTMSLETYYTLMGAALSYFTVLYSLQ